jgi:hypothetical protein
MGEQRTLRCPEGHEIMVETWPEYVEGEKIIRVEAHSSHPQCELCQDMLLVLRQDPEAFQQGGWQGAP